MTNAPQIEQFTNGFHFRRDGMQRNEIKGPPLIANKKFLNVSRDTHVVWDMGLG